MMYQYICVSPGNIKGVGVHQWSHDIWSIMLIQSMLITTSFKLKELGLFTRGYYVLLFSVEYEYIQHRISKCVGYE